MPRGRGGGGQRRKQEEETVRIAIVSADRCKPKKCKQECKRHCPVNRQGKMCVEATKTSKLATISEILCIGCNICVKKCPFGAITIINLPANLEASTTHRFGPNSFKLHRLPMPRMNQVLGLVGTNGIGKSSALKILAGKMKPNLGNFQDEPTWEDILRYYRGSELQNYFTKILEDDLRSMMKPQYVDHIPKKFKKMKNQGRGKTVRKVLGKKNERDMFDQLCHDLDLVHVADRDVILLSGGELQRFAIAATAIQDADVYMFDEPSSYLDVKQRLKAAHVIRSLVSPAEEERRRAIDPNRKPAYVIVVEHDLAVLDYLSDYVCCLYGTPGVFGVVTMPFGVREGINVFLAGFIPTENMRFRQDALNFKVSDQSNASERDFGGIEEEKQASGGGGRKKKKGRGGDDEDDMKDTRRPGYYYPSMEKTLTNDESSFHLVVDGGSFRDSQITVMLGENGTGKTTFVKMLAGMLQPDGDQEVPELRVSYKPQKISPTFEGSVQELLMRRIRGSWVHPQFQTDVAKPMKVEELLDQQVLNLSGGELQRVALVLALGTPADVYLIDEPSAYLDSEQRIVASKVIKRYILHSKKSAFVVEHDFIMATYLADRVVVFEGIPGVDTRARSPQSLLEGMNMFLRQLDITFRRDPTNFRPRINKKGSVKDQEQKASGNFFFLDADD